MNNSMVRIEQTADQGISIVNIARVVPIFHASDWKFEACLPAVDREFSLIYEISPNDQSGRNIAIEKFLKRALSVVNLAQNPY